MAHVFESVRWTDEETKLPCAAVRLGYKLPSPELIDMGIQTKWWCGYVGIDSKHPLYNRSYNDHVEGEFKATNAYIPMFMYALRSDSNSNKLPIDCIFDVHGGITYSGYDPEDDEPNYWWFGFDCNHAEDTENPKNKLFVMNECAKLAKQLRDYYEALDSKESQAERL